MNITTCLFTVLGGMATLGHPSETVRLNQLGYYPQQEKVAVVNAGEVREFTIVDAATGNRLLSGKPGYTASSAWSDKSRTILDFSDITVPGRYLLLVNGDSVAFEVKEKVLSPLADAALKSFYYQRTGMPIEATYAGRWSRPAGHPDDKVLVHPNAAGPERKAGAVISSPGGWHDAGGRYRQASWKPHGLHHQAQPCPRVSQYRTDDQHYPGTDGSGHVGCVDTQKPRHGCGGIVAPQAAQRHCGPVPGRRIQPGVGIEITSTRETMNKYVTQLLEVIQKKTGCDTSSAVRWLAEQAGVSERTAWNWKQQEKLRKATEKNLGRIAEELKK